MESLTITIETTNAAFADDLNAEVARILHDLADRVAGGMWPESLNDINGNRVGSITHVDET